MHATGNRLSTSGLGRLFKGKQEPQVSVNGRGSSLFRRRSSNMSGRSPAAVHSTLTPQSFPAPDSVGIRQQRRVGAADPALDPPPAYSERASDVSGISQISQASISTPDDPYAFLSSFDTIFLIDDSGSMAGRSWRETSQALSAIAPICAQHDGDGVDVVFMNTAPQRCHSNLKDVNDIQCAFNSTKPRGGTPTGATLDRILRPYLAECESKGVERVKPLNIIVITDGVPSDDPESVIMQTAKRLDKVDAPGWQIGIQFFQVGQEPEAAEALKELDDGLVDMGCPRDIVDTVPWKGQLSADGMLKVVLGAVNRRIDRRRNSGESRR